MEQTLSIIKPDGVERNLIGSIVAKFEEAGLRIAAMKKSTFLEEKLKLSTQYTLSVHSSVS